MWASVMWWSPLELAPPLAPCLDARLTQGFRNLRAPVTEPHSFHLV